MKNWKHTPPPYDFRLGTGTCTAGSDAGICGCWG